MLRNRVNQFLWNYNTYPAPSTGPGISIAAGITNAEGAWTALASAANIAYDVWAFQLHFYGGSSASSNRAHVADIGIDPAGGTAYTELIADIMMGHGTTIALGGLGRFSYWPLRIPAGSSVAVRVKSTTTSGTIRLSARFFGRPTQPGMLRRGTYTTTYGITSHAVGTAFTPGSNSSVGNWTLIGALTRPAWWHNPFIQISNTTFTAGNCYVDLSYGNGIFWKNIVENYHHSLNTNEYVASEFPMWPEADLKTGENLYMRGSFSGTPNAGYSGTVISVGGDG